MGQKHSSHESPLVEAAFAGDERTLELLLAAGSNPVEPVTLKRYGEVSAVVAAVHNNQRGALRVLLENIGAADMNLRFGTRQLTALHVAAAEGRDEICETLLAKGADQRVVDVDGNTALMTAVLGQQLSTVWVLGQTALHVACDVGDLATVSCLLKAGADPNVPMKGRGRNGRTPIYVAVAAGLEEVAAALLTAGSRIDVVDEGERGMTLLHLAVLLDRPRIVRLLMEYGVDIETGWTKDARVSEETPVEMPTPLLLAAAYGRVDCFKELLNTPQGDVDRCLERGGRVDLMAPVVEKIVGRVPETPEIPIAWAIQYPCRFVNRSINVLGFKAHVQFTSGMENMGRGHFACVELLLLSGAGITSEQLLRLQENLVQSRSIGMTGTDLERLNELIHVHLWQCAKCGLFGLWPDGDDIYAKRYCSKHCLLAIPPVELSS